MKRTSSWIGAALLALAIVAAAIIYSSIEHIRPLVDGQVLEEGAQVLKDGDVSIVLVEVGPGKVALIDAGMDPSGKAILAALTRRGLAPESVVAIFLTHGHADHTGGCNLFPGAAVYALESEAGRIGNAARVTHLLHDGEISQVGTLRVETFAMPGHTPGSAAYLAKGILFLGDSAAASKEGKVMRLFAEDSGQNIASLKALAARLTVRAQEVKVLAFAHSGPLEGFAPLAAFAGSH